MKKFYSLDSGVDKSLEPKPNIFIQINNNFKLFGFIYFSQP
jgi:hypothetical protein